MTYKQIETSREIRLWVTGIIGPVILAAGSVIASDPELLNQTKQFVKKKRTDLLDKVRRKRS